jgi:hypothetical protein
VEQKEVIWTREQDKILRADVKEALDEKRQIREASVWREITERINTAGPERTMQAVRCRALQKGLVKPLKDYSGESPRARKYRAARVAGQTAPPAINGTAVAPSGGLLGDVLRRLVGEEIDRSVKPLVEAEVRRQLEELLK